VPKKSKYEQIWTNEDGWSDWFYPQMDKYEMACCDCCLVHDIEFQIVERTENKRSGEFMPKAVRGKKFQVGMRVARNNRATANARRAKGDQDG
jgi:hypothetical protein